jgi:hypothetical protein
MTFDLNETADCVKLIALCAGFGAAGGIAYDLVEPLRRRAGTARPSPNFGDDRLIFPWVSKQKGRWGFDAGFIGPMFVGAIAATIAVFVLAVNQPSPPTPVDVAGVVKILGDQKVSADVQAKVTKALESARPDYVDWKELVALALSAGFAGVLVLRKARERLLDLLGAVKQEGRVEGTEHAKAKAKEESGQPNDDPTLLAVTKAVSDARLSNPWLPIESQTPD